MPARASLDERVRKIVSDLGEDDDVMDAVKEGVDFRDFVGAQMKDPESPIYKAATAACVKIIEGLNKDDDFVITVKEAIEVGDLVKNFLGTDDGKKAVHGAIKAAVEGKLEGEDRYDDPVGDALDEEIDVPKQVREALKDPEVAQKLKASIASAITVKLADEDFFGDLLKKALQEAANDEERVKAALQDEEVQAALKQTACQEITGWLKNNYLLDEDNIGELINKVLEGLPDAKQRIMQAVGDAVEKAAEADASQFIDEDAVTRAFGESEAVKQAVEDAIQALGRTDKLQAIAGQVAEKIAQNSSQLMSVVLGKIGEEMAARFVDSMSQQRSSSGSRRY